MISDDKEVHPCCMSLIRSAGLQNFRATVEGLGGDADLFARQAGLCADALDTDDLMVEDTAMAAVLEIGAASLRCRDLGLRVGAGQNLSMLGPLAVAIQHSHSVADALECTSRYMFVHARGIHLSVVDDPKNARGVKALRYAFADRPRPLPQAMDMSMHFIHRALRFLVGGSYGLRSVHLPYQASAPVSCYEEAFGVPVLFGQSSALLRIPASLLRQPLGSVDATLRELALSFLAAQKTDPGPVFASRVRNVVAQSLGTASTELTDVARVLAVHPRTAQRRLAAEGTAFGDIVDGVRRARAKQYLTTTDMPLDQVSRLLGFSDQAVLSRCARRWWDLSPTQVRRDARGEI